MNLIINLVATLLFVNSLMVCMDPIEKNPLSFTFVTEKPSQRFTISLDVAKRCQAIKEMFEDLDISGSNETPEWQLQNNSAQTFEFVYYLQNIHRKNTLSILENTQLEHPKKENPEKKFLDRILNEQIKTLSSPELISLFTIVDNFNVLDRDNNHHITNEIARRIIEKPANANIFYTLNNRPLFRNVVQKISTMINFEKIYIEPYADIAIEQHELERTLPIVTTAWYNITNALTAPLRLFTSRPWTTKTIMKPYYLNTKTGTMITGFSQKLDPQDKVITLLITNKNTSKNISVSLDLNDISTIKNIEANATESLFICRTTDNKTVIINTLNEENMIIDQGFIDCVFSDNNEVYFIKDQEFGIWNTQDNTFKIIYQLKHKKYTAIKINKNRTYLALCCDRKEVWLWKCKTTFFDTKNVTQYFDTEFLCNICLHPTNDILYVQYYDFKDSAIKTTSVNIGTKEVTLLDLSIPETSKNTILKNNHSFRFLSDVDDILFVGTPQGKDYFINTKNNHVWAKEKNKKNMRMVGIREANTDNDYERITLTTDGTQSIEQIIKAYPLIDFISVILAKDNDGANLSFKKIIATTLIDATTIQTIKGINEGFLSPQMITALLNSSKTEKTNTHSDQGAQKIMSSLNNGWKHEWARNILYCAATLLAIPLKLKMDSLLNEKNKYKSVDQIKKLTFYGIDVGKTVSSLIAGTFLLFFLERVIAQY